MNKRIQSDDFDDLDILNRNIFTAYLRKALRRKKRDYLKKKIRITQNEQIYDFSEPYFDSDKCSEDFLYWIPDPEPQNWNDVLDQINDAKLRRYLSNLSDQDGNILFMWIFEGLKNAEIDEILSFQPETTATRKATIIRKIRKWMKGNFQ